MGQVCVFAIEEGCGAASSCQDKYCGDCPEFALEYCDCQGQSTWISCSAVPSGFAVTRIASMGPCLPDAGE